MRVGGLRIPGQGGKVISLEKKRQTGSAGGGIGDAVPEVECRRGTTLAIAKKRLRRLPPVHGGEGLQFLLGRLEL